jgi:hypothetical protein
MKNNRITYEDIANHLPEDYPNIYGPAISREEIIAELKRRIRSVNRIDANKPNLKYLDRRAKLFQFVYAALKNLSKEQLRRFKTLIELLNSDKKINYPALAADYGEFVEIGLLEVSNDCFRRVTFCSIPNEKIVVNFLHEIETKREDRK